MRHRHDVAVTSIASTGRRSARPAPRCSTRSQSATRIVIAPSNPLISIDPILQVPGVRAIAATRDATTSSRSRPSSTDAALKGPADRLLGEMGHEVSCVGVADFYKGLVGTLVIDEADAHLGPTRCASAASRCVVTTTIMAEAGQRRAAGRRRCWRERTARHRGARRRRGRRGRRPRGAAPGRARAPWASSSLSTTTSSSSRARSSSKSEGRVVAFDGHARGTRSRLVEHESRRVLRRRGTPAHHRDRARLRQRQRRRRPVQHRRRARRSCCPRTRTARLDGCAPRSAGARGVEVAVVVTDTFGRAWRQGVTDVAHRVGGAARRCSTCAARPTPTAGSSRRPRSPSPTRSPGPRTWSWARPRPRPSRCVRGLDESFFGDGSRGARPGPLARTTTSFARRRRGARRPRATEPGATCSFAPTTHVAPSIEYGRSRRRAR